MLHQSFPSEKQAGRESVPARRRRNAVAWLHGFFDERPLLLSGKPTALPRPRHLDHFHFGRCLRFGHRSILWLSGPVRFRRGLHQTLDTFNGDHFTMSSTTPAAVAGYPSITVPAGQAHGLPVGISIIGTAWSEPRLIALAYAYEQATKHRRAPAFRPTLDR